MHHTRQKLSWQKPWTHHSWPSKRPFHRSRSVRHSLSRTVQLRISWKPLPSSWMNKSCHHRRNCSHQPKPAPPRPLSRESIQSSSQASPWFVPCECLAIYKKSRYISASIRQKETDGFSQLLRLIKGKYIKTLALEQIPHRRIR